MKITYASATGRLEFNDLGSSLHAVGYEARNIALSAGESMYLVETGDVLLSAQSGDIHKFAKAGKITVNDSWTGAAPLVMTHNFNFIPKVSVSKLVGGAWVGAIEVTDYTVSTNAAMTVTTVTAVAPATFLVRIS